MGFIRSSFLMGISFLLIIFLLIGSFALSLKILLYPDVYRESFEKHGAYEFIENGIGGVPFLKLPKEDVEPVVDDLIVNFLSYIRGDSDVLNLSVELDREKILSFFKEQTEGFTVCIEGEDAFVGSEIRCRPAEQTTSDFLDDVLEKENITFLDEKYLNLADVFFKNKTDIERVRSFVKIFQLFTILVLIIALILIFLIFIFNGFYFPSWMRWTGFSFISAGALGIILSFFIDSAVWFLLQNNFIFILSYVDLIIYRITQRFVIYNAILCGTGLALFFCSFFVSKKGKDVKT